MNNVRETRLSFNEFLDEVFFLFLLHLIGTILLINFSKQYSSYLLHLQQGMLDKPSFILFYHFNKLFSIVIQHLKKGAFII